VPVCRTRHSPRSQKGGTTRLVATLLRPSVFDNDAEALPIRADARVVAATLKAGESADYTIGKIRRAYLVPATGAIEIAGRRINARDGAATSDEEVIHVTAIKDTEIVMVAAA